VRIPVTASVTITIAKDDEPWAIDRVRSCLWSIEALCVSGARLHGIALEWHWQGQSAEPKADHAFTPPRPIVEACWTFSAAYDAECSHERAEELAGYLEADIEAELCNLKARANRYGWADHVDYHTRVDEAVMRWSA
jgi:hypothetical protein